MKIRVRYLLTTILILGGGYLANLDSIPEGESKVNLANQLDSKRVSADLMRETSPHNHKLAPGIDREETWAKDLTESQVDSINKFVGVDADHQADALPGGGYRVSHTGKFRHGVVLQKQADGSLIKHEVGPNGIANKSAGLISK